MATIPDIIDNRTEGGILRDIVKKMLRNSLRARIATGYFYLSGFDIVKEDLEKIEELLMIIGDETDRITKEELIRGHSQGSIQKNEIVKSLIADVNSISHDDVEQQKRLNTLHEYIQNEIIKVKIYTKEKFHAKAYLFDLIDQEGDLSYRGIVGSSNFTKSGLEGNTELNSFHAQQSAVEALNEWFMNIFENEAEPFKDELLRVIESSAPYIRSIEDPDYLPPFELFKKIIYHYLNQTVSQVETFLAEFQKLGVENALDKINDYNGVIISDSVGLGKTYIGADLVRIYRKEKNSKVLFLLPASVIDQWKSVLKDEFHLDIEGDSIRFESHTKFSIRNEEDIEKEFAPYDLILIDEAHNFRNKSADIKRSKNIERLKGKNFVLLTATPLNNSVQDLKNLIDIFAAPNRLLTRNLDIGEFDQYIKLIRKERGGTPLSSEEEITKLASIKMISKILDEVMILRTRSIIKKRYPNLKIGGKRIVFSNPKINPISYNLSQELKPIIDRYGGNSDFVTEFIVNLNLPHIFLASGNNGQTISGLYRILLLKRLESSIYTFVKSLENLLSREMELKREIETLPWIQVLKNHNGLKSKTFSDLKQDVDLESYLEGTPGKLKDEEYDRDTILAQIDEDIKLISAFKSIIQETLHQGDDEFSYNDNKLNSVITVLEDQSSNKLLIFTQFRDTAEYLHHHIQKTFPDKTVEIAMGGMKDKIEIAKRFAPIAYNCDIIGNDVWDLRKNESLKYKLGTTVDMLISTDTLSEGVNLQDCDHVFNYDLPWNPTRIIQRVGRIDRIGSNEQKFVYNVKTDDGIESLLKLMEKLKNKIEDIAKIVGREHGILSEDELPNPKLIGEKIKQIQDAEDLDALEETTTGTFFKNLEFGERKDSEIRLELREIIRNLNLTEEDFNAYSKTEGGYSLIIKDKDREFVFIYNKLIEEKSGRTLKDVVLKIDKSGEVSEISPIELSVDFESEGSTKTSLGDSTEDIIAQLTTLREWFDNNYLRRFKVDFDPIHKPTRPFPKIQQMVCSRLDTLIANTDQELIDDAGRTKKTYQRWKLVYSRTPLSQNDARELNKRFGDLGKNPMNIDLEELLNIIIQFNQDVIEKKYDYQEAIALKRNVRVKEICWGAFV